MNYDKPLHRQKPMHTVEKIGGTSMSNYQAVRDNVILNCASPYQRAFVVSAYGGITDALLEHKKSGKAGVFALFANDQDWQAGFDTLRDTLFDINHGLFDNEIQRQQADRFIGERLDSARQCLENLQRLCEHGHFALAQHLNTVREMLASIGEAHSAWNMAALLRNDGINARFVDLTAWQSDDHLPLDQRIESAFADIDFATELPIVTGYAHSEQGLMRTFDRGYSEMTFSRIAVLTQAREAVIHKEFHLSSADPRVVGEHNAVPIGRTNYDVADQLANLGMEAIHPKAAKGLRQNAIPLRVKNTFEPEHNGTLITGNYVSSEPCVEIIAGCKGVYALQVFDQNMAGELIEFDTKLLAIFRDFNVKVITKDANANSFTYYLNTNLKILKRLCRSVEAQFPEAEVTHQKVAIVSAIGSDLNIPGMLAKTVKALADNHISVLALHQSMRQVDMQFVVNEADYEGAIQGMHRALVEIHDHGRAICLA